ncbi:caspase family protein [Paractinoplanes rishiriensis]|uniref:Peptidase C14 caspase domain-containing protein n=1 Tax=Paractinoplanes rishiriensis TaxID=1050105 RepID=A0A919MWA2_9ACTN|nr:caspase family protein [Actinoplanes rishiriensis]GIE94460.1 hypothetical protein Ari01nite_19250 [Actinoplanes rishiriensis]
MTYYEQAVPGPGTHALIIGVGGYPHLPGGTGAPHPDPSLFGELAQLTSPPLSAVAVAEWLVKGPHERWTAPLASVELLVSPHPRHPETGTGTAVPTLAAVKAAYRAWRARAQNRPDNVALFYFCGHGVQAHARRILLTSDFAENEDDPFGGAFSLEPTRDACVSGGPATQAFFVDSCAAPAPYFAMYQQSEVRGLASPAGRLTGDAAGNTVTILASPPYGEAASRPGEVSHYTRALLGAFDGHAASRHGTDWLVTTGHLYEAMTQLVNHDRGDGDQVLLQSGLLGDAPLWRLAEPPPVLFTVSCIPDVAHCRASFVCERHRRPDLRRERPVPEPSPWPVRSVAGSHLVQATFTDGCYPLVEEQLDVVPRTGTVPLRVVS